ncbi:hypothetical protein [Marinobacter sp. HN1S83]|uniref:hypothetical protein n=1 Tax=Marinobacter sp. HN1S83 TaxID=3382301 RepID=UPI00387AEB00
MRIIGALTCALILGIAVFWVFSESTPAVDNPAFNPPVGDVRYFSIEQTTEIGLPGKAGRRGASTRMSSVLRSEVLNVRDGVVELQTGAVKAVERSRGRALVDTERGERQSADMKLLAGFLQSGVVERVSTQAVPIDISYRNQDALDSLDSVKDRPEVLQTILLRSLGLFSWYPAQVPDEELTSGLSWQTPDQELGGSTLTGLQFEVSHLDEQTVTLTFGPADTDAESAGEDLTANAYRVAGYLELERDTGWPRRASVQIVAGQNHKGSTFQVTSQLTVRQTNVEQDPDTQKLLSMAQMSLRARPVDTSSSIFDDYFVPPFGPATAEESLAKLERTLLWFGPEQVDYGYGRGKGLEPQLSSVELQRATFHPVASVRLFDAEGKPIQEDILPNPDFTLLKPASSRGRPDSDRVPFLRQDLTDDQLALIDVIELDVPVTTPDQMYSAFLDQNETVKELKEAGLKLSIDEWNSRTVRIRVSETGGISLGELPRIMGYPVDKAGEPVPQFGLRMTHSTLESILGSMDPRGGKKAMAEALMRSLSMMPPHEKDGEIIFEFTGTEADPIERLKFHYYSTRTEEMTFSAPAARTTMNGGEVVGQRTLYRGNVPRFDLKPDSSNAPSYRMERAALPVTSSGDAYQLEQVARGTLQISEELLEDLLNVQSTFDLKHLPLVAYDQDGGALVPFWHDRNGEPLERLEGGGAVVRFWGDIASVNYPTPVK